jgi:hypothetical protein
MNCPQCQAANGPDAAFCRNCGARLAQAGAPAAAGGYSSASGTPAGYGPASGQAPTGYPQDQYAQGQYQQGQYQQGQYQQGQYQQGTSGPFVQGTSGLPPVSFNLARLTKVDKIVAGATLVTMISLWLPWYSGKYSVPGGADEHREHQRDRRPRLALA